MDGETMTAKTRLQKLEAAQPKGAARIAIHYEHAKTVRVDGLEMSLAEWQKIRTDNDCEILVRYASEALAEAQNEHSG
jgi:hypothetical protein